MIKIDAFLVLLSLGIYIYGILDVARKPQELFQIWNKNIWLLIVIVPLFIPVGSLTWLFWGRKRNGGNGPSRKRPMRDIPPDDNPDFLRNL